MTADLLSWLIESPDPVKWYWRNRDNTEEIAATGIAALITGDIQTIFATAKATVWERYPNAQLYGGACFDVNSPRGAEWSTFPRAFLLLPKKKYSIQKGRLYEEHYEDFLKLPPPHCSSSPAHTLTVSPSFAKQVENALRLLETTDLQKIVLAYRASFSAPSHFCPFRTLKTIQSSHTPAYYFAIQMHTQNVFFGASPERLYHRHFHHLLTEALAGTVSRGQTEEEDKLFVHQLLTNPKILLEHEFVCSHIENFLNTYCTEYSLEQQRHVYQLTHVQHLRQTYEGNLIHPEDAPVLNLLHPTPAIGGIPSASAVKNIPQLENFDRGFYGGFLGSFSQTDSEVAVALRCGLQHQDSLYLYAGAGIVKGSQPEEEEKEIYQKLLLLKKAILL